MQIALIIFIVKSINILTINYLVFSDILVHKFKGEVEIIKWHQTKK